MLASQMLAQRARPMSTAAAAVASASSTSTQADGLSFTVTPMSGPTHGGTSLEIRVSHMVDQVAAGHALATMTAHIAGVALRCTHADAALRCCCTPAGNATQSTPLVIYRSLPRASSSVATAGTTSSPQAAAVEVLETPVEARLGFHYYEDPLLLRLSPVCEAASTLTLTLALILALTLALTLALILTLALNFALTLTLALAVTRCGAAQGARASRYSRRAGRPRRSSRRRRRAAASAPRRPCLRPCCWQPRALPRSCAPRPT